MYIIPEITVSQLAEGVDAPRVGRTCEESHEVAGVGGGENKTANEPPSEENPEPR